MIYINCDSTDATFWFAFERYAMDELDISDGYFMFWRTNPTLMIGRYQNTLSEINMPFAKAHNINIVRRITGGGTIYTDMNGWQFSFIIKHSAQRIGFAAFTQPILDALSSIGVEAQLSGRNDLMIGGKKFSGNAQHIGKNALLHHGSILFDTDLEALVCALGVDDDKVVSKGIKSVRQRVTNVAEHLRKPMSSVQFRDVMLNHLLHDMDIYEPTLKDIVRAGEIKRSQFDSWEWNFGKNPKFNITKENRFAGGKLTVQSFVKNGFIVNIRFYGDFFATEGLKLLEESLIGCRYNENDIKNALEQAHADGCIYQITADEILSCII